MSDHDDKHEAMAEADAIQPAADGDSKPDALSLCMAQRDNMQAIFDSVADGIFTIDGELRVTNGNVAFKEMVRCPPDKAQGCVVGDLFRVEGEAVEAILRRTLAGDTLREQDVEIRPVAGGELLATLHTAPLTGPDGAIEGAVVVLHDVTRLRALQDDLRIAYGRGGMVGSNERMREIYSLIDQLADNDVSVLITGESGTGKEVVATAIHEASHRSDRPFIRVNCAALSETLLESELFGHVRGSFTGAIRDRVGRFEAAHRGTLFLDEIGAVNEVVQRRLLRVLQEREFERVGDEHTRKVDVRVLAATNADLKQLVIEGRFREDLYYRLNVVQIEIPPLRARREDIPLLAQHLLDRHVERMGRSSMSFDADALASLMAYSWEGNVRQLENAVQRALVVCRGRVVHREHLPPEILAETALTAPSSPAAPRASRATVEAAEVQVLLRALEKAGGNVGRAAELLGVHRTTLWRRLKRHGLRPGH